MKSNHLTHNDKRGSFTAIDSRYLDINWEQFNVVTNKIHYIERYRLGFLITKRDFAYL